MPVHDFSLLFSSGGFIFFLLISNNSLYIKAMNALLYRLQVLLFSTCWGSFGFVYLLQILTWYQVSPLRVKHLLTSLCLPGRVICLLGVWQLLPITSLPAASGADSGGISPRCFSGSAFIGEYACCMGMVSSHSSLEFLASPKRKIFFTFPDFTLQLKLLR